MANLSLRVSPIRTEGVGESLWPRPERMLNATIWRPNVVNVRAVEKIEPEPWDQCKDRYGDGGLALVLTLAPKYSGLTLGELTRKMELQSQHEAFHGH